MVATAAPNSGFVRDPVQAGGGYDYFTEPGAPDDVLRFWRIGEHYPRLVIDLSSAPAKILVGNGLAYPTGNIIVGPSGLDAVDIAFTPNGSIAATDVQHAIQEVRDEAGSGGGGGGTGLPAGGSTDSALLKNSGVDGDADWRILTAGLIGAATAGALSSEQGARTNADVALGIRIDGIVVGGGTGDMLYSANLFGLTDLVAARANLGLGDAATRFIGLSGSDVAAGDAPQAAVDAIPKVDFDSVAVPTDPTLKADFDTTGGLTSLRGGNLATLDDIATAIAPLAALAALTTTPLGRSRLTTQRVTFSNTNYTVLATDSHVAQTGTLSAARTVQLPAASAFVAGQEVTIADESGTPTVTGGDKSISIVRAGSDTIVNETDTLATTTVKIRNPYASFTFRSDGVSKWLVTDHGAERPYFAWQDSPIIAVNDEIWTPQPFNVPQVDPFNASPGLQSLATTVAVGSNGATLPTATINVASTAGFPTSGYIRITGPPGTGVDTIVGYTGKTATSFTGCNSTGTIIPTTGISTGTLATGQVVTGANCRWSPGTLYLYNLIVQVAWAASLFGSRNVRVRDVSVAPFFPIATGVEAIATGVAKQTCQVSVQPGIDVGTFLQVEVWQSSGAVLNTAIDGLQAPSAMLDYATAR